MRHYRTVYKWCREGKIPGWMVYDLGGTLRFKASELLTLARRRGRKPGRRKPTIEMIMAHHGMPVSIDIHAVYSANALAEQLKMSIPAINDYVAKGMLRFIPTAKESDRRFLGKHVLEFLDSIAQTIIPEASLAGATGRGGKIDLSAEKKQESAQEGASGSSWAEEKRESNHIRQSAEQEDTKDTENGEPES